MISYSKRYIKIVSLVLTILIYIICSNINTLIDFSEFYPTTISKFWNNNENKISSINEVEVSFQEENIEERSCEQELPEEEKQVIVYEPKYEDNISKDWYISIPVISLYAEIAEGTEQEVLNKYVGHFAETSKTLGNIGLAAHNRGYSVNYFKDLKKLKEGDEIKYKFYEFEKTYYVTQNKIIKDTDWEVFELTDENIITLITCVENEPEFRRCIQGVSFDENINIVEEQKILF